MFEIESINRVSVRHHTDIITIFRDLLAHIESLLTQNNVLSMPCGKKYLSHTLYDKQQTTTALGNRRE